MNLLQLIFKQFLSAYVYNANYYKSLTAELTGHIWQAVHTRGQSSISIKLVKRAVQEFVSELQEFEEGIQDQLEYDFIIQDLSNFLQEKDGIGFSLGCEMSIFITI